MKENILFIKLIKSYHFQEQIYEKHRKVSKFHAEKISNTPVGYQSRPRQVKGHPCFCIHHMNKAIKYDC